MWSTGPESVGAQPVHDVRYAPGLPGPGPTMSAMAGEHDPRVGSLAAQLASLAMIPSRDDPAMTSAAPGMTSMAPPLRNITRYSGGYGEPGPSRGPPQQQAPGAMMQPAPQIGSMPPPSCGMPTPGCGMPTPTRGSGPTGVCGQPLRPGTGYDMDVANKIQIPANRGQELLSVAVDVQRIVEANSCKPVSIGMVESRLTTASMVVLGMCGVSLETVIQMHPSLVCIWEHAGNKMVSWPGCPWLGPTAQPPSVHGPPGPRKKEAESQQTDDLITATKRFQRGKAPERMVELAKDQMMQDSLREISLILLSAPGQQLLVSELGTSISATTRGLLQKIKLRTAQLLRCFPNDFKLEEKGPGSTVKYLHFSPKTHFEMSEPELENELNTFRLVRLLKLAADATTAYQKANGQQAHKVLKERTKCLLVDCRTEFEQRVSIIPNAIPSSEVTVDHLLQNQPVIAYCCLGICSAHWCHQLAQSEWVSKELIDRVSYIIGGVAAWAHAGGPLVDQATNKRTQRIHCWSLELAQCFPVKTGYEVTCAITSSSPNGQRDANYSTMLLGLERASQERCARLRALAWEVRLRYCPHVFCLEAKEVLRSVASKVNYVLVDCRTEPECEVSMVEAGCRVITKAQYDADAENIVASAKMVITYCTVGGRSGHMCQVMTNESQAPSGKFGNLLGGIAGWLHAGGSLCDASGRPTRRVNPWCRAFMDLFPVAGVELACDELQPTPVDALAFVACGCNVDAMPIGSSLDPEKVLRTCQTLPPSVLADSLTRAAQSCEIYTD